MKNTFIIASVIFILSITFWGVYNLVFKKTNIHYTDTNKSSLNLSNNKSNENQRFHIISESPIIPKIKVLDNQNLIYFCDLKSQTIYESAFNKGNTRIVDKIIQPNVKNIIWSPNSKKIIFKTDKGFFFKKIGEEKEIKLDDGIDRVVWTNLGDKIIYKYYNSETGERSLNLSNPDGSFRQKLALLEWPKMKISPIFNTDQISIWNYPQNSATTVLKSISFINKEPKDIFSGIRGGDYLWSPSGSKILVSSVDKNNKMHLGVVNSEGKNYKDLNLSTFISKCVWLSDDQNVICTHPINIPSGSLMPDDYNSGKIKTRDNFWKINVLTGEKKLLVPMEEINADYDAIDLSLSKNEEYLLFINRQDKKVYRLKL